MSQRIRLAVSKLLRRKDSRGEVKGRESNHMYRKIMAV